ncbi:pre-60S ribosomal particles component [Gnomoniopsis smithogilvyi]|uniref:Pre-60S ribosomal particles component n=1 Tax=Gnomoniopsis smithogilvyi TaxID=1191159 RepID=A0A9W8YPR6_9PEZI|nr:pre-60S ribosomal particles component [Gnomoniopsis smithogilvyi]
MAGTTLQKRSRDDAPKVKAPRPTKKQRKQALDAYHSDSDADADADEFPAVNLMDSDSDDIHNARADAGGASDNDDESDASSISSNTRPNPRKLHPPSIARNAPASKLAHDAPPSDNDDDDDDDEDNDEYSDLSASEGEGDENGMTGANALRVRGSRAKRNDPAAFATSMSKILSTKLSTSRRADPVLARSAAAHEASRQAVDSALETKARKQLRMTKRAAMEKGRVRDVLVATNGQFGGNVHPVTGEVLEGESVGAVVETERRLRKVAQRGVVQLFNAFRVAQVKAVEAERGVRKEGIIGVDRKKEKVTEMSKKGFLDLIASGGGGLKKGPMEEA